MPAKKKAAKKAAAKKPVVVVAKPAVDPLAGLNFPCDVSVKMAGELYEQYGERFVAMCHPTDAVTVSWLVKVAGPTLAGKPPKKLARANFKDRVRE